jgi:hypothetical protein
MAGAIGLFTLAGKSEKTDLLLTSGECASGGFYWIFRHVLELYFKTFHDLSQFLAGAFAILTRSLAALARLACALATTMLSSRCLGRSHHHICCRTNICRRCGLLCAK